MFADAGEGTYDQRMQNAANENGFAAFKIAD